MSNSINGRCLLMCPEKERWTREKEGLLHRLEIDERTKGSKRPKADPEKVVKCFSRPAAGQSMTDPEQLRLAPVLLLTIRYLLTKVAPRTDFDWVFIYDFIFDRLRSVRQDIVIQRISGRTAIQLYEPIVRFLIYSAQRLIERQISEYDSKINKQHLSECIKHLLVLYDEIDATDVNGDTELSLCLEKLSLSNNRPEMEAAYILLYMGDVDALNRALHLPKSLRESPEVQLATKISLAWYLKNYVRVCSLSQQLPPLLICAVMINLQNLRRIALKIMSAGYNSKTLTFPGLKLQELLLYKDIEKIQTDCKLFGLTFTDENVLFQKSSFNDDITLASPEMHYSAEVLHSFLPYILLQTQ